LKEGIILLCITLNSFAIFSQSKQDYQWFFGTDQNTNLTGIQGLSINFNNPPSIPFVSGNGLEFDQSNVSICNEDGDLLFYTNGCAISNRNHELMENSSGINSGSFFDLLWQGDCSNGYPGRQDIMVLQDPVSELGYYLIHKTIDYLPNEDPNLAIKHLKYSYVDMSKQAGLGEVTIKNTPFLENKFLSSYLTAIRHINQKDWWIIQPKDTVSLTFFVIKLSSEGFEDPQILEIPDQLVHWNSSASGDAKFSPDGSIYAYYNMYDDLNIFDFDRELGILSNHRKLEIEDPEMSGTFSSVEFSSNSRFVYLSNTDSLFQVDLWEENLENGKVLIGTYDGSLDPLPTTFFISILGPDCRIYIRPGSSSYAMHVINKPNEKGLACDFVQRGLRFSQVTARGSFPNFPRYRVDEEDKCDPSIISMFGEAVYFRKKLQVYPNPTDGVFNIRVPEEFIGTVFFFDLEGREVKPRRRIENYDADIIQEDISNLNKGTYNIEFIPDDSNTKIFWSSLIQKF